MAVSNEFIFYKANCTQNVGNCVYPHKVVVTNAEEFNEMAKHDHVCAKYRDNYRGNNNFLWANTLPADSDNDEVTDSSEWITPEDIHQMFVGVPHIISKSKNNMKTKGNKPAVPRNHVFFTIEPETDRESYAALKKLLHKHYPFFDPKALDVGRYLGVRQSTKQGYVTVQRLLAKEKFGSLKIRSVKISDAKLFLIKLQQEDGKSYSTIHNVRGVLRPAFQMAVDDDIIVKNPFRFQLQTVLVNDSVTREALTKDQMRKFLKFIHDDVVYCKYYEVVYILFHTGMRISEFCGLTLKDIDLQNKTVNIDHQLQRTADMRYIIVETKTDAGKRKIPITDDVAAMFQAIIEDREAPAVEKIIDGYTGFLFYDKEGKPLVAMHWQHRFNNMVNRYNDIYRIQMPNITPHVCRHTYCSNQAKAGMNPKTLQYLMGHSDISVTMNVYTHMNFDDAEEELRRMEEFRKAQAEIDKTESTKTCITGVIQSNLK